MKLLIVLVACFVAAQATSLPSYQSWCNSNFWLFPDQSYYRYTLPFNRAWCTPQYYSDILKEFPQPILGPDMCEAEQANIACITAGYRTKLEAKRTEFKCLLEAGLPAFKQAIDTIHARYQASFECNLQRVLCKTSTAYALKVAQYCSQLAKLKSDAVCRFNNSVTQLIAKIKAFHDQILANFENCLTTRKARVDAYILKLNQRSCEIQQRYAACITAAITKRVNWVRCVFTALYSNQIKQGTDFENAMCNYQTMLDCEKTNLIAAFKTKIEAAVLKIKNCYRCNYKCYFNSGCYGFSRRSYRRSCTALPNPPRYNYKLVSVSAFKPQWKGCRSSTVPAKTTTTEQFDVAAYNKCIDDSACQWLNYIAAKVTEWKGKVTTWKCNSLTSMKSKICTMYPRGCPGQLFTQCQIDAYRARLEREAQTWLDNRECELLAQITSLETRYKSQVNNWSCRAKAYITKVKQQFDACVANKCQRIQQYTCQLDQMISTRRSQLYAKLKAMADRHKLYFRQFYQCSFGCNPTDSLIKKLKTDYECCVDQKVCDVIAQYDLFWCTEKPKLIEIYKCSFKCLPKVSIPQLRIYVQWNFCPPQLSSFFRSYC